jgi:predicted RNase H-like nuclease
MDPVKIEQCEFSFRCPKTWDLLYETNIDCIRFCDECNRNVYLSRTVADANSHTAQGHCVAIPIELTPYSRDQIDRDQMVVGSMSMPPVIAEDRLAIQNEFQNFGSKWLGIDGCPAGWFYVGIGSDRRFSFGVLSDIEHVSNFEQDAELILIDIPIGLPSAAIPHRGCDSEARKAISPRSSSVFPVPARSALAMSTYEAGSAANWNCLGRKLSRQSWAIAPKIREVDRYMLSNKSRKLREMHPEVAFWALNGCRPMRYNKKKEEGFDERMSLLERHYPDSPACFEKARRAFIKSRLADDDILDALVGAVTAMQSPALATFPAIPVKDEEGLVMEIVFAAGTLDSR